MVFLFAAVSTAHAQDSIVAPPKKPLLKFENLKLSGYIQVQNQWGGEAASLKVGAPNKNPDKAFNRFGIRRGRLKLSYTGGIASAVFQLDATEKGVGVKDAYFNLKEPWLETFSLRAGIFDRPFGYEISYSSSVRESPERSTIFQTLFPGERDLGAMLTIQAPETSPWSIVKLEAGLFAGNGIKQETDNRRDFIGSVSVTKKWENISLGGGVSYYNGGSRREYLGAELQFSAKTIAGITKLTGEYIIGRQPGLSSRTFGGGYAMLVQQIAKIPVGIVLKYDWYDSDIMQSTLGAGVLWDIIPSVRLTTYYEMNRNDKQDDVLTVRLQYKF